jgi:hypothetical protein
LKILGIPLSSNGAPSLTIFATPFELKKMCDIPEPLNPARIYWFSFPGTFPQWGKPSAVVPITEEFLVS